MQIFVPKLETALTAVLAGLSPGPTLEAAPTGEAFREIVAELEKAPVAFKADAMDTPVPLTPGPLRSEPVLEIVESDVSVPVLIPGPDLHAAQPIGALPVEVATAAMQRPVNVPEPFGDPEVANQPPAALSLHAPDPLPIRPARTALVQNPVPLQPQPQQPLMQPSQEVPSLPEAPHEMAMQVREAPPTRTQKPPEPIAIPQTSQSLPQLVENVADSSPVNRQESKGREMQTQIVAGDRPTPAAAPPAPDKKPGVPVQMQILQMPGAEVSAAESPRTEGSRKDLPGSEGQPPPPERMPNPPGQPIESPRVLTRPEKLVHETPVRTEIRANPPAQRSEAPPTPRPEVPQPTPVFTAAPVQHGPARLTPEPPANPPEATRPVAREALDHVPRDAAPIAERPAIPTSQIGNPPEELTPGRPATDPGPSASIAVPQHGGPATIVRTEAPVTLAPPQIQNIGVQIAQNISAGTTSFEIALHPAELGQVRMALSIEAGNLTLNITAERPDSLDLMRRNAEGLASDLADLGFADISMSFGDSKDTPPEQAAPNDAGSADAPGAAPVQTARHSAPAGGLDLRL